MVIVLAALACLAAAAIIYSVIDPFGGAETIDALIHEAPPPPSPPVTTPEPLVEEPEPEPVAIASVLVELASSPSGAMVAIGEQSYGPTPAQVELTGENAAPGAELTFVFTVDGYWATTVTRVVPDQGRLEVNARMHRVPRPSTPEEAPQQTVTLPGYRDTPY